MLNLIVGYCVVVAILMRLFKHSGDGEPEAGERDTAVAPLMEPVPSDRDRSDGTS